MQTTPLIAASTTAPAASRRPAATPDVAARPRPRGPHSIATQLERDRLEQRAARVKQVLAALRERADVRGATPRPLRAAIEDFGRELADLERQMRRVGAR